MRWWVHPISGMGAQTALGSVATVALSSAQAGALYQDRAVTSDEYRRRYVMALYAGVDLHSNNGYYGIIDENDRRVFRKRLPNDLSAVLEALAPFQEDLFGVAVESTYNWYWLVDGLTEAEYPTLLANPAAIEQYNGLKDADDDTDAFFLAHLLRLGILPEGYIYPKEERPVRDLLRRRTLFVKARTAQLLSFKSLVTRETGEGLPSNTIKAMTDDDVRELLHDEFLCLAGESNLSVLRFLTEHIQRIEKAVLGKIKLKPEYEKLLSVPGIGTILGLTIMLETGPISRFPGVGNYSSYCRCVEAKRRTNGKVKGSNNRKNGNRYLGWAYVEAANFTKRHCPQAKKFYQRKVAQKNQAVAIKALASKLSKACYFILRDQVEFDLKRIFG